jgi:hypothetical protein
VGGLARIVALGQVLAGHILEQRAQVDLLLEVATQRHPLLLADDGHHRRVVELRVVEAVEQMDGAGAGGGHAHPDLTGELGVGASRERRQLLVAHLDELDLVAHFVEGEVESVGAVTGIAVDTLNAPFAQALQHVDRDVRSAHALRTTREGLPQAASTTDAGVSSTTTRRSAC